jgi:AcrR family transcriptional regulator
VREWIPVPGTARGELVLAGLREFAVRGYGGVGVGELARAAGVTTGALYHHFGSKLELYRLVRRDVEQRVLDRMAGAADALDDDDEDDDGAAAIRGALSVGFRWAVTQGFAPMLAEEPVKGDDDPIGAFLAGLAGAGAVGAALGAILVAAWRAALRSTVDGMDADAARRALGALTIEGDRLRDPA